MKKSTCYLLMALATLGWLGGVAKMDWIYKELRSEKEGLVTTGKLSNQLEVPQYYRFNQHYTLTLNFDEHIEQSLRDKMYEMKDIGSELMNDDYFSHIFKKVKSEHMLTSADGEFVNMECTTWLDLSHEVELAHKKKPVWQTDFSQIKSIERNDIVPLLPISDSLADQLLQPLLGYCLGQNVDVWRYTLCVGAFSRQEMTTNTTGSPEVYSLGVNNRLNQ